VLKQFEALATAERCCLYALDAGASEKRPTSSVYWDQASQDVSQHDNVTMTCTVTGVRMLDVVRLTHHVTTSDVTTVDDVTAASASLIADNDVIKEEFAALGRYRVLYHVVNGTATIQLRILGSSRLSLSFSFCLFFCLSVSVFMLLYLFAAMFFFFLSLHFYALRPDYVFGVERHIAA